MRPRAFIARGGWSEAIELYERTLEAYPNDPLLLQLLMQAYTSKGDVEKAEALSARVPTVPTG